MTPCPILHLSVPVDDLAAARNFYEHGLGCRVGRVRETWLDVWFFGLQLTLHERPGECRPPQDQGVRHFGVVMQNRADFDALVARVRASGLGWLDAPATETDPDLSGKTAGRIADPAGNIIEIKFYKDTIPYRA